MIFSFNSPRSFKGVYGKACYKVEGTTTTVKDDVQWHYDSFIPKSGHIFATDEYIVFKPSGEPDCCLKLVIDIKSTTAESTTAESTATI